MESFNEPISFFLNIHLLGDSHGYGMITHILYTAVTYMAGSCCDD